MKILVCAKRVVDPNVRVRIKADHSNVEIEHSKMSLNPFDETAIEAAVRLKEQGIASEVIAVSIGNAKSEETLRTALARGCDRGILVVSDEVCEPIHVATILAAVYNQQQPNLVLMGKQAIDDDANQVSQMLAAKLDLPQATNASLIEIGDNQQLRIRREVDGGTETLSLQLPAVVSADLNLNEPRFIKLPQLMQAKKKPLEKLTVAELGLTLRLRSRIIRAEDGEKKKNCRRLNSVAELVNVLAEIKVTVE